MSVINVVLEEAEVRVCVDLAVSRWLIKKNSIDRPNYAKGKELGLLEHELLANIRANVSEYAVSKYLGFTWTTPFYLNSEHKRRMDHPDVGMDIEVRTLRTRHEVPVWRKDIAKDAFVVATSLQDPNYYTSVDILGYLEAAEVENHPEWHSAFDDSYRVPVDALLNVDELLG
jgi:hypothetical protein